MIADLLPPEVMVEEAFDDRRPAPLFAAEEELVVRSTPARRREFATARDCARRALARLGYPPVPVLRGPAGSPRWPDGVAGSMTHCAGYRAAAVAPSPAVAALGIDAEPALPLPVGVLGLVGSPAERDELAALATAGPDVPWDRLLFCAKEATYKAWFPRAGRWLGFRDATVSLDPDGTFTARIHTPQPGEPTGFAGRWRVCGRIVLAAVADPARARPGPRRGHGAAR